jgi:hypothetical protein
MTKGSGHIYIYLVPPYATKYNDGAFLCCVLAQSISKGLLRAILSYYCMHIDHREIKRGKRGFGRGGSEGELNDKWPATARVRTIACRFSLEVSKLGEADRIDRVLANRPHQLSMDRIMQA